MLLGFLSLANLASCSNRIRTVHSLGGGISLCAGHKKAHKTLWHAKSGDDAAADAAAEVRGKERERESGCARRVEAMGSGILCRQQQQQMTLIAFLSALFAASVAVAVAVD